MNDDEPMETAAMVYARIRRRQEAPLPAASAPVVPDEVLSAISTPGPIRIDEVLHPSEPPGAAGSGADPDTFPRSATMRFALEHPAMAVAIGIPTALLVARSPTSRRLLVSVARIGASPLIWRLAQLSASAITADRQLQGKTRR